MAYTVAYLIDIKGIDFNNLLAPTHRVDATYFDGAARGGESDLRDGILSGCDTEFLVDLTGLWTLCKLPYPYSCLLGDSRDATIIAKIEKWEHVLQLLLPYKNIYRIDDFLIEPLNSRFDYLLVRHPREIEWFIDWMQTQDRRYWAKLPAPLPE